jgi:hypothetical protein
VQSSAQASAQPANGSLTPPPPAAQISAPASSESRAASTSAAPASVAALAEIPTITDVSPGSSTNQALFAPDQTGAAKWGSKAATPVAQTPGGQVLGAQTPGVQTSGAQAVGQQTPARVQPASAVYPKRKPEQQGLGPMLRHLFSARGGNT